MKYLTHEESAEYQRLEALAAEIEAKLEGMVVAVVESKIPDEVKVKTLNWIDRANTFRGLSYFLHPQPEWMGGDSSDPKNFKTRAPHIANL